MNEEERWTMHGLAYDDPDCLRTVGDLERYIEEVGFLPFFRNEIPGFSVEEHTAADAWWSDDPERDPWIWRGILASRGRVLYGKFFNRGAGFISRKWFPAFANYRRDGYDFDARWDDELASKKSKKIMDLFMEEGADREIFSFDLKEKAGYGKSGEKNFEGEVTSLQMQTYLCIREFKRRKNQKGQDYGWGIAVYCTPEHILGYDLVSSLYSQDPKESVQLIFDRVRELYPDADDRAIRKVVGLRKIGEPADKKVLPYPDNLVKALKIEGLTAEGMTEDQKVGLEVAVGQLRDKQQRTIVMKYRDHKNNEEIGQSMNRAAGTVSTYHSKGMGKLKWPSIAAWYLDGYDKTIRAYLAGRREPYPDEIDRPEGQKVCEADYCLRIGISLKQFDSLQAVGICTIGELTEAMKDPGWYRKIRGIGPRGAADILNKLERSYLDQDMD